MNLCLSVMSYHRFTSGVEEKKFLSTDSGESVITIGRASQCSWCLLDPERVISSRHARIESNNGQFWLYDTSTNGVFVNRSVEPLAKDTPYQLNDGDVLAIGDYEIEVAISAQAQPASVAAPATVSSAPVQPVAEDFGVLAEPEPVAVAATSLDSRLNANLDDAFALPKTLTDDEQSSIPEDWNALFSSPATVSQPAPQNSQPAEQPAPTAAVVSAPAPSPAVPHVPVAQEPVAPRVDEGLTFATSQNTAQHSNHVAPAVSAPTQQNQAKPTATVADEHAHLTAFLEGMGISAELVSQDNPVRWWHQLGVITRDSLDGIMNTLHNRAAFKENSRINQTTFRRNENNPLKFSTNAEDAIHNLLQRKTAGFLPPERAVKEAFIDLERHEYALLSGIEGAVAGVMQLLDPKSIESKDQHAKGIAKVYSAIEKHKSWNRYCSIYSDLENEFSRNSNAFYMEDFAKAYESSLKSIEQKG
ncbi:MULTISPECIES: type VI secretion system-associated FHA domain protein TagH [unclassified Agarivorans]|uniref:type VI secretion system-associated FHA domain protein TagH n=1 Tax=unclassified Agarivorans TaxID=2636026 RepID=UPI0026E349AC|nr:MULTISPECIES: type VI secretion system-associated FHA domain protein TagH [unclassified Agarivorans]MDO6685509.1 type VI secretion system-associated FHA domain protein TagH [Agarivorans sp. 3_MG-2023]MDO6715895.1 type VI secretion system-associated FHA domain protein TagH [Agarivorans sp. 2_MG-2023]